MPGCATATGEAGVLLVHVVDSVSFWAEQTPADQWLLGLGLFLVVIIFVLAQQVGVLHRRVDRLQESLDARKAQEPGGSRRALRSGDGGSAHV